MRHLYAPWRSSYFKNKDKQNLCPLCEALKKSDDEAMILFRREFCFGIMNLYPYSPGEFMVIPYEHIDNLENLDVKIWQEISKFVQIGVGVLKNSLNASGVNIGMNLGIAGGAGISEHIHYHLVPRWVGDTNFITSIGDTRVNGVSFDEQYNKLKEAFRDA